MYVCTVVCNKMLSCCGVYTYMHTDWMQPSNTVPVVLGVQVMYSNVATLMFCLVCICLA